MKEGETWRTRNNRELEELIDGEDVEDNLRYQGWKRSLGERGVWRRPVGEVKGHLGLQRQTVSQSNM